jgi:hypothetical protein
MSVSEIIQAPGLAIILNLMLPQAAFAELDALQNYLSNIMYDDSEPDNISFI